MDANGITVASTWISMRFPAFVATTSLTNEHFTLFTGGATPVQISDPWLPIDVQRDYESISRTLTLYFKDDLTPSSPYTVGTVGLLDPADRAIIDRTYPFTTLQSTSGLTDVPPNDLTFVTDQSVISDVFTNTEILEGFNPLLYVVEIDPSDSIIDGTENNGRIIVKFSSSPDGNFINSTYFKVQRKQITTASSRWQTVNAQVSIDGSNPWVYVDLPSTDATPVYNISGSTYYESGYKYRLKISKDIGKN